MTTKKSFERYPVESSPFYRMGRSVDLATLLGITQKQLRDLIIRRQALYYFKDEIINGKRRSLAVPIDEMRRAHERIQMLLRRIILPEYLYSPRRGRTPVDNAVAHLNSKLIVKLDIKQFYPSTTDEHVFQFFRYRLGIVDDVAGRLTKLCTIDGKVPFGSPLSPILCALVHDNIFTKAALLCELEGDTMTLWVDDLTISGDDIGPYLVKKICRLIASKRMQPHKTQRIRGRNGAVITGTFISQKGPSPANKLHLKMKEKLAELHGTSSDERRLELARPLIGLVNHFMTVYPNGTDAHTRLRGRLTWLHNLRRKLESAALTATEPKQFSGTPPNILESEVPPWN